jgi:hypothetical protein
MRHFLLGAIARLAGRMVATARVALLVAACHCSPLRAASGAPAKLTAVDLPTVAAAADVKDPAALTAPRLSKAVSYFVAVVDALTLLTATSSGYLHGSSQGANDVAQKATQF